MGGPRHRDGFIFIPCRSCLQGGQDKVRTLESQNRCFGYWYMSDLSPFCAVIYNTVTSFKCETYKYVEKILSFYCKIKSDETN